MKFELLWIFITTIFARIIKSNRRSRINRSQNYNTEKNTIHDDPDHVDFDYRRRRHGHSHKNHHTGTVVHVKKRNVHTHHHDYHHDHPNPVEKAIRDDIKKANGLTSDKDLSVAAKTLAREAGKGNQDAVRTLRNSGVLSDPLGSDLVNASEKSPYTGMSQEDIEQLLNETPHTSAPMKYSSMKEVQPGANPDLDKTLSTQKLMDWFRSFLPSTSKNSDEIMQRANDILTQAPNGDINAPYVDENGKTLGNTYGEEAEAYVKNAALAQTPAINSLDCEINGTCHPLTSLNKRIDQSFLGNKPSPAAKAIEEYEFLIQHGVPRDKAEELAAKVRKSIQNEINERKLLADAIKENAHEIFVSANHIELQHEIEQEKNADKQKMIKAMNDEPTKQQMFPWLHPVHVNEEEIGFLKQLGNIVPADEIGRKMFDAYNLAAKSGGTEEDALNAAARTGYLLSEFNNELRKGVSPVTATALIKERGNIQDIVEQRRSFVQNNGPEIAQLVAENTNLIQKAVAKIARNPENKDDTLKELDNNMKKFASEHAKYIHHITNVDEIHKPRKAANDLIDETMAINNEIMNLANRSPIVAKDIMKKGMDNARKTAEVYHETLEKVDAEEKKHSPIPKSALRLLDEAKKEQQLDQIAKHNAEAEKQQKEAMLKEQRDTEVMATEERIAKNNKEQKISEFGMKAADRILNSGGTINEAKAAKEAAEKRLAQELENKEAVIRQNVLKSLSSGVDATKAAKIAKHVALAHSGVNAVGKTPEEVMKNELEERKKEALEKALYSDMASEKLDVLKVIPADASEVNINNSVVKFPLNTFVDEKPKDKGEEYVKNKSDALKNLVRNTVTRNKIDSGLNTIQTSDGFLNAGENSTKIHIQDATAYIKPFGKLQMEKEGIDTSKWKSQHNQGERPDIPNGELYYEANIQNADLQLPTPINKTPSKLISNGVEQLDANQVDELHINKGTLNQVPWNEFSDLVKPRLNLYPNEDEKIKEAITLKNALEEEKKKEKLDSIKVYSFTNPNGDKHITTIPQYGITEYFEEGEGMKRLSNINPDKNIAISETPIESLKEPMINNLENVPEDQVVDRYIQNTITEGRLNNKAGRFISPVNGFTGQEDATKTDLLQKEVYDVRKHFINDTSESSRVKNDLISKTEAYSKALGMEKEDYINLVKSIPDSTIYKMDKYNERPATRPTELLDKDFSQSLQNISSNTSISKLVNYIFNSISKITGKPNNVSADVLERQLVPNLKEVRQVATNRTPTGTSQSQTIEPPRPGSTVLSEVITNGTPNISTGPNTSYKLPDPTRPPFNQVDSIVRNPGNNPLTPTQRPFSQTSGRSINTNANPLNAIPDTVPSISPLNRQAPPSNAPRTPAPAPGLGARGPTGPRTPAPGRRLGIASSPRT